MFELPDAGSPETIADWIELELASGTDQISKSKVSSVIEAQTGSEPSEAFLSDIWRHLGYRQSRYSRPFFRCDEDLVVRTLVGDAPKEYIACLLFSVFGVSEEHRTDPKVFERLVALAIQKYLHGKAFVFGWPVLPSVQTDIALRVQDVAAASRERFIEAPPLRYKDRGVDVIAWAPFEEHQGGDHRSGQVVILAQCAAGANWRQKTGQLPHKAWNQYIHWACEPLRGFAVPAVIPPELWHDVSKECDGVIFDRIRIVNLTEGDTDQDEELSGQMEQWIALELNQYRD